MESNYTGLHYYIVYFLVAVPIPILCFIKMDIIQFRTQ